MADDIQKAANDIAGLTGDVREFARREMTGSGSRVDRILGRIEKVTADASKFTSTSLEPLNRSIRNVEIITSEVREALKLDSGNEPGIKEALAHLKSSLDNLDQATASLASIARKVDSGQGTLGRIVNDDKLITKTEQVVEDVGSLVSSVSRLQTSVGFRSEFNIQERALKNYLGLRFQPDPGKYYLIELVFDPRGKTSTIDRLTLTNDPSLPPALAERVTETRMDIKFSLQFAKRLAFVTGRFGLIESTGGLGLDFEFFKDSLKFSFDLFDFGADRWPRFKALAAWEFVKHFYVTAGVDDIVNKRGRDYFAGAGFRFTDDDLKMLLMVAPTPAL
jgi:phospholipid/cholesterol/gamma-HCH transport system substrate-binding protein